jgi:hypothetical protein
MITYDDNCGLRQLSLQQFVRGCNSRFDQTVTANRHTQHFCCFDGTTIVGHTGPSSTDQIQLCENPGLEVVSFTNSPLVKFLDESV